MSRVNDGGPAFAACNEANMSGTMGMSLRDYFAGQALAGLCSNFTGGNRDSDWFEQYGAASAWQIADAMIAAREVKS